MKQMHISAAQATVRRQHIHIQFQVAGEPGYLTYNLTANPERSKAATQSLATTAKAVVEAVFTLNTVPSLAGGDSLYVKLKRSGPMFKLGKRVVVSADVLRDAAKAALGAAEDE